MINSFTNQFTSVQNTDDWYTIFNINTLDTPALVVYPERVKANIRLLKRMVNGVEWLRPHVKTHKMAEVSQMMLAEGISKFKCATIAEAEMLASTGATDVLLAYQPVGPKINRLLSLAQTFPDTQFSCIFDNLPVAQAIASVFAEAHLIMPLYLDLNVGMDRTGIKPGSEALNVYMEASKLEGVKLIGLHAYDGHVRDMDFSVRTTKCDQAFEKVAQLAAEIVKQGGDIPTIVAGGSPTFPIHAQRKNVECSPGTFIFWDWGYKHLLLEQPFEYAALVLTRVISKLDSETLCLDLGHKAIAADNPLPRVKFLNAADAEPIGHSEEHLVVKVDPQSKYQVGDVFYGVPIHICPTCALYDKAHVIENGEAKETWQVVSRNRMITI